MAKAKKKAKKAAKKKKAKMPAKKKSAKPKKVKKQAYVKIRSQILGEAPQEFEFYLSDGRKLKSVYELIDALETMNDDLFGQHVNEMKNDFGNWIKDVFKEPNIAKEMKKIQDKIETQKLLMKKLIQAAKKAH
jgi:hypothetical protein